MNEYQRKVWELVLPQCRTMEYLALGLGEAGEIQGKVKKILRGDPSYENWTLDIKKELGDLLFYVAALSKQFGLTLQDVADSNIEKLHDRRARGVLQGSGDNR